ncbi:hypothetical protein SUNI508_14026 [Seiridium unicorne]|uniref:Uncharacterized protein n=1 Tax=Seiridium unicorne TaxID=138068 RepID=A0ABR2VA98_9PEZI
MFSAISVADLKRVADDERLHLVLLVLLVGLAIYGELSSWRTVLRPGYANVSLFFSKTVTTLRDYRSGKYYKPWKQRNPIMIVHTKKQIAELSESSSLSQRAVYADARLPSFFHGKASD